MTRRFLAYFLIWLLIAVPTLSYAWLPIVGGVANTVIATKAGQVLSKKGARWVKHQYSKGKLSEGLQWLIAMCGSYQSLTGETCIDVGRKAYDILTKDGWQTEQNGNGIEIYKQNSECQEFDIYYGPIAVSGKLSDIKYPATRKIQDYHNYLLKEYPRSDGFIHDNIHTSTLDIIHEKLDKSRKGKLNNKYHLNNGHYKRIDYLQHSYSIKNHLGVFTSGHYSVNLIVYNSCYGDKTYLTKDDIWDMIQDPSNGFNDQDITNILKYDYSDKSVTINNHTYNGGDIKPSFDPNININRDGDGTDGKPGWGLEIDPTFAPKLVPIIVNPNIKIGLPDINYNNCTANAQGAIVNCDKLERKYNIDIDGDGKIGNDDPTCPDGYTLKDDKCVKVDPKPPSDEPKDPKDPKPPATKDPQPPAEQKPWVCSTSSLTQKICSWIDWTKEEPAIPADDPIIPIDKTKDIELDKNILTFNKSCPAPQSFSFNMLGKTHSNQFDFKPFCDVAIAIKPIILAVGGLVSIYILTGTPRPSDD